MKFLYDTVLGRLFLKILLHTKILNLLAKWLRSPYSKWLITPYIKQHNIDMQPFYGQEYESFADFFARKRIENKYVKNPNALISPCDGRLSIVSVEKGIKFYIKNSWYSIYDLVPDRRMVNYFKNGLCMIFRLSGRDYHHFCYIDDCYHGKGNMIPGKLHSVQPAALEKEPVFRLNKRMWSIMETKNFGMVAQIEVGAVLVGDIVHEKEEIFARRGEEMGHFELCGSTVILLFKKEIKEKLELFDYIDESIKILGECMVRMGDVIGCIESIGLSCREEDG